MPPTRMLRPVLAASSRLLQEQSCNGRVSAAIAASRFTAAAAAAAFRPRTSNPSICSSCSFHLGRQLRFSSSKQPPPEPPNFDHLKPEDKSDLPPSFEHLRPVEEKPEPISSSSSSSSSTTTPSESEKSIPLPPPESSSSSSTTTADNDSTTSSANTKSQEASDSPLPSQTESQRSKLSTAFTSFMDRAQSKLFLASQHINDLSGYSEIETLKNHISHLETSLTNAQEALHTARNAYKVAVADRSTTQREVTTLLARQKTWTPADFERFTALYRTDYELEVSVADRARELEEAEREAERLGRELSAGILARYHEEQIWSDKIRRMSTWGTWGLMGVNILLFFMFQFGAEPWRRARLVKGFEEKVREALEHEREKEKAERMEVLGSFFKTGASETASAQAIAPAQTAQAEALPEPEPVVKPEAPIDPPLVTDEIPAVVQEHSPSVSWRDVLTSTAWWRETWADLTSERKIGIRMRDVSMLAVESAAAGAALAGTIAIFFLRRT